MEKAVGSVPVGVVAILLLLMTSSALRAQQWNVDAQAGRIHSALDPNAPQSQTVALGLRYDDEVTLLRVSGGVPMTSADPLWGSIAGARRIVTRTGAMMFGVDVGGHAVVLHDRVQPTRQFPRGGIFNPPEMDVEPSLSGSAFAAEALPVIGYEGLRTQAYLRAGVSHYASRFGDQSIDRTVRLADGQLTFAPSSSLMIMPAVRHYRAAEGNYTYTGVSALAGNNQVNGWATVGQWLSADASTPWAAGASVRLHERAVVSGSVRRDVIDPLYLAPPQTAWNIGVSVLVGGKLLGAPPVPARYDGGRATIRLSTKDAPASLRIAGDFNDWKPAPMQRSGDDWTFTTALKPGVYNYAFVKEDGEWFVPAKYPGRKDDGMGGHVAVLVVEP
jgi:hypothetical protein